MGNNQHCLNHSEAGILWETKTLYQRVLSFQVNIKDLI